MLLNLLSGLLFKSAVPKEDEDEVETEMPSKTASVTDVQSTKSRKRIGRSAQASKLQLQPFTELAEDKIARMARESQQKQFSDAILMIQKHERARAARCISVRGKRIKILKHFYIGSFCRF